MIIKQDDKYSRAWKCDYQTPILYTDDQKKAPPDPPEIAVRSHLPPEETWNH